MFTKEITLLNQTYQARFLEAESLWLLDNLVIANDKIEQLIIPNETDDLPQNLEAFIQFLTENWQNILKQSQEALDFLGRDWFNPADKHKFDLDYIELENTQPIWSYTLAFYENFYDQYAQWVVKFYFKNIRGVERIWL